MEVIKYLRLHFTTVSGDESSITVRYPKDDLTGTQVETCMNAIIGAAIFTDGLNGIAGADIYERTITDFSF